MKASPIFTATTQERTEAQEDAQRALSNESLAITRFVDAILAGFQDFWGTPDSLIARDKLIAKLEALGADNYTALATRHATTMQFLITNGLVSDVEQWQLETPYVITIDGSTITVGEELSAAWTLEA